MPTKEGCTNLPEPESRFRRSVSVPCPLRSLRWLPIQFASAPLEVNPRFRKRAPLALTGRFYAMPGAAYASYCITEFF